MSKKLDKKRCGANVEKVIIDEFVPSKELDALERGIIEFEKNLEDDPNNEWLKRTIAGMKKCYSLLKAQEQEKVLEIINEKEVNISSLKAYDLEEYNMIYENKLTQEEFDLLKRWMENDK